MVAQNSTCDFLGKKSRIFSTEIVPARCRSGDVQVLFICRSVVVQASVQVAFTGALLSGLRFSF